MMNRKIIHLDMDAFYASVEQRDFPELRGKPVIVGGQPDSRGVVAASSYEARKYGIYSAMPSSRAYKLCPQAVFVRPRFSAYKQVSAEIHKIFNEYTDIIEPLSLDEAYLDVSDIELCNQSASMMAKELRGKITKSLHLTASAGISYNKFLAKLGSDQNKPNGQFVIKPGEAEHYLSDLPIGRFYGVGKVTEAKMKSSGINTGGDLNVRIYCNCRNSLVIQQNIIMISCAASIIEKCRISVCENHWDLKQRFNRIFLMLMICYINYTVCSMNYLRVY